MKTSFSYLLLLGLFSFATAKKTVNESRGNERGLRKGDKNSEKKSSKGEEEEIEPTLSILDLVGAFPEFSILNELITGSEAASSTLAGDGPFTVFAPTDEAFEAFIAANSEGDAIDVDDVLFYHVLIGAFEARDLESGFVIPANGEPLNVFERRTNLPLRQRLSLLPNTQDVRFEAINIQATNGVIHVIDQVLVPPSATIAEIAAGVDDLAILVSALDATGLLPVFEDETGGPFTVFAPVNSAFEDLGEDLLNQLNDEPGLPTLTDILLYHVVPEVIGKEDLRDLKRIRTLLPDGGGPNRIRVDGPTGRRLDDSNRFINFDIIASNGVVHLIDEVLIPRTIEL